MKALETLPQFKVIAAIPAYNEANHITSIIKETEKYVDQVLVIDDGSTDGTGRNCRKQQGRLSLNMIATRARVLP